MTVSVRCAVHPEIEARAEPCERCGNFGCETCFLHPKNQLCEGCRKITGADASDAALPPAEREALQRARSSPVITALKMLGMGLLLGVGNVVYSLACGRYFPIAFPLAGILLGMALSVLAFTPFGRPQTLAGQRVRGLIFVCMTLGGLLAGIALSWLVRD